MKKLFAIAAAAVLAFSLAACSGGGADSTGESSAAKEEGTNVYVTIACAGGLVVTSEPVGVIDTDEDGAITVHDVLVCAHEKFFEGGAAAGYAEAETEWGASISKLWGDENGGSYMYYVNNAGAMSLVDPVAADDYVAAFSFADLENWSDVYTYFDSFRAKNSGSIDLVMSQASFDEDWNPVELPVEGATITIDGAPTEFVTDANGAVTVTLEAGSHVISATAPDGMTICPPSCVVTD